MTNVVTILLVDDDDVDAEAIQRGLRRVRIANPVVRANDGVEAMRLLRGEGCESLRRPYLVLLDLKMPRKDGLEVLAEIRSDPSLKDAIVFMLTTSKRDEDRVAAYGLNVAGYIVKEKAGRDFLELLELLECYWRVVEFPPTTEPGGGE